jgi:hypothetical protein
VVRLVARHVRLLAACVDVGALAPIALLPTNITTLLVVL